MLYVSPLKALAVDVERNLRSPLTGIRHTADRLGQQVPEVTVGVRSGDTPAADRRRLVTQPPDIMITTPESLFLMLTSQARESLRGVETVIVDEVHAVAGTKRGAHLAVTLERLDALLDQPGAADRAVRDGAAARGGRPVPRRVSAPVEIVAPPSTKEWDLQVVVPVEDMTAARASTTRTPRSRTRAQSIWPHVEEHVVDLIEQHRSRSSSPTPAGSPSGSPRGSTRSPPSGRPASGAEPARRARPRSWPSPGRARGVEPVIAKAHHGSVSKEQRALIEDDLKRGRLPAWSRPAASSSASTWARSTWSSRSSRPPSVASALQRVGRAGHQVGEVSRGVLFPKHRGDLAQTAVAVQRMRTGAIESLRVPDQPARRARPAGRRRHGAWTAGRSTTSTTW